MRRSVDRQSGRVRRSPPDFAPGVESGPRFSPDGSLVAFTGSYDGNVDVYVVPTAGGVPTRLTWHPGNDIALGFTPDGKAVLFSSPREVHTNRYTQLFTVPVARRLPHASCPFRTRARPRSRPTGRPWPTCRWRARSSSGSTTGAARSRGSALRHRDARGRAGPPARGPLQRHRPMWIGDRLYFRSDRDGEFNLYSYDRATKAVPPHPSRGLPGPGRVRGRRGSSTNRPATSTSSTRPATTDTSTSG